MNKISAAQILHIATQTAWRDAQQAGKYAGDTLTTDGFIHCSLPKQVVTVANTLFHGRKDLLLLYIDVSRVQADIRYEDLYDSGEDYPHIYGSLNLDAVIKVVDFLPGADGKFIM